MNAFARQIETASDDGREFTIVEFATYRWERDENGERRPVQNDATYLLSQCGIPVVHGAEPGTFFIPQLNLTVHEVGNAETIQSFAAAAETMA